MSISDGKITGATDTDYFYFFCPRCPDQQMLRILDYDMKEERPGNPYNSELKPKAARGFILAFQLYCQKCKLREIIKVGNMGWQGGKYEDAPANR